MIAVEYENNTIYIHGWCCHSGSLMKSDPRQRVASKYYNLAIIAVEYENNTIYIHGWCCHSGSLTKPDPSTKCEGLVASLYCIQSVYGRKLCNIIT